MGYRYWMYGRDCGLRDESEGGEPGSESGYSELTDAVAQQIPNSH